MMDDEWWQGVAFEVPASKDWLETKAKAMAEAVNGGKWETDYTEAQKRGWALCVAWDAAEDGGNLY